MSMSDPITMIPTPTRLALSELLAERILTVSRDELVEVCAMAADLGLKVIRGNLDTFLSEYRREGVIPKISTVKMLEALRAFDYYEARRGDTRPTVARSVQVPDGTTEAYQRDVAFIKDNFPHVQGDGIYRDALRTLGYAVFPDTTRMLESTVGRILRSDKEGFYFVNNAKLGPKRYRAASPEVAELMAQRLERWCSTHGRLTTRIQPESPKRQGDSMTDPKEKRHFDETGDWLTPPTIITPDGLEKPLTDPNTYADGARNESDD